MNRFSIGVKPALFIASVISLMSALSPTFAQMPSYDQYPQNVYVKGQFDIDNDIAAEEYNAKKKPKPAVQAEVKKGPFDFTTSATRRSANYVEMIRKTKAVDASGGDQLERLLAKSDIVEVMGKVYEKIGLRTNNLIDVMAIWQITSWMSANGFTNDPTLEMAASVKRQVAATAKANSLNFDKDDAKMQKVAENLLVQGIMFVRSVQSAAKNPSAMAAVQNSIKQSAMQGGFDVSTVVLTPEGFKSSSK